MHFSNTTLFLAVSLLMIIITASPVKRAKDPQVLWSSVTPETMVQNHGHDQQNYTTATIITSRSSTTEDVNSAILSQPIALATTIPHTTSHNSLTLTASVASTNDFSQLQQPREEKRTTAGQKPKPAWWVSVLVLSGIVAAVALFGFGMWKRIELHPKEMV
ncbi:hypothetical protein B0J14DRAFT_671786 [Halenospora varia]|nr:hypothetical protein B0J14DRAFT_671786 [Halenospora varia]